MPSGHQTWHWETVINGHFDWKIICERMIFHCIAMFQRVRWIGHGLIVFLEGSLFLNQRALETLKFKENTYKSLMLGFVDLTKGIICCKFLLDR